MNPSDNRTPTDGTGTSRKITLDGIWNDFYEQIRRSAGNGLIVRVDKDAGVETYTRFETELSSPDKLCIMFAYEFSRHCIRSGEVSANIAGELMHGILAETQHGAAKALKKILEQFGGGMNITALEREREYIEKVIRKTFAAKFYICENRVIHNKLSEDELARTVVLEDDYRALCNQLLAVFTDQYVRVFAKDERYAWLFSKASLTGDDTIIRYLVALLCAALISIDTDYKQPSYLRKLEECRSVIKKNILRFLSVSDSPPPEPQLQKHHEKIPLKNRTIRDDSVPFGLTEEEYNDRRTIAISVRQIRAAYPGIDASKLAEELSGFLEAAEAAFSDVWSQYSRKERALEIVRSYYEEYELGPFDANHQTTIGGHHGR